MMNGKERGKVGTMTFEKGKEIKEVRSKYYNCYRGKSRELCSESHICCCQKARNLRHSHIECFFSNAQSN